MKRHIKLFIMLGILAVLVVSAIIQKQFFPAEVEYDYTDDGGSTLRYAANDVKADGVTELSYEIKDEVISFVKTDSGWMLKGQNAPQIKTDLADAMVKAISGLSATNKIENVAKEKLEDYGLTQPSVTVKVSEGNKISIFLLGGYNKTTKEYYFCDKNIPDVVFTVESSVYDAFQHSISDLIVHETLPKIEADSINKISITGESGEMVIESIKTPNDENEEGYTYSAIITKNGESEKYSYADFYKIAEEISNCNINDFVGADESVGNEYGFDNPKILKIDYIERQSIEAEGAAGGYIDTPKSLELILGSTAEDGKSYCKTSEKSWLIYKLSTKIFSQIE